MSSPSVNLKFHDKFSASLTEAVNHSLMNIETCSLHVVHGSFKNREAFTQWDLKKLLNAAFHILHGNPARRDD